MNKCMYTYMHTCVRQCVCTCLGVYVCVCIYASTHAWICVHICLYVCVCIFTHIHTHIFMCLYVRISERKTKPASPKKKTERPMAFPYIQQVPPTTRHRILPGTCLARWERSDFWENGGLNARTKAIASCQNSLHTNANSGSHWHPSSEDSHPTSILRTASQKDSKCRPSTGPAVGRRAGPPGNCVYNMYTDVLYTYNK